MIATLIGGEPTSIEEQVNTITEFFPSEGGQSFLHVGPGEWPHREGLRAEVAEWMTESLALDPHMETGI